MPVTVATYLDAVLKFYMYCTQARSQDLEKGGGAILKEEKSANDLDPNFH